jgi:hypothetical protein
VIVPPPPLPESLGPPLPAMGPLEGVNDLLQAPESIAITRHERATNDTFTNASLPQ